MLVQHQLVLIRVVVQAARGTGMYRQCACGSICAAGAASFLLKETWCVRFLADQLQPAG